MLGFNTIAQVSTPPGKGGVALIRVSGDEALAVASHVFKPRGSRTLGKENARVALWGNIYDGNEAIDDGICIYFPAPHSYTGEDMAEIYCHGGILITRRVLEAVFSAGAESAEAGEFTRRAFINGKLSLTDAEGIGMLLDAKTDGQLKLSRESSRSRLSERLAYMRATLTALLGSMFARLDYPDEDLGDFTDGECLQELSDIRGALNALIDTYATGRAVSEGISTVICGRANVGKSTLYNLLAGDDYAIVTDIPGTTRDVLEREVPIGELFLRLYDTAGLREDAGDTVEAIGITRTEAKIKECELIIALFDATSSETATHLMELISASSAEKIAIINKCDLVHDEATEALKRSLSGFSHVLTASAKERPDEARAKLTSAINELFLDGSLSLGEDAIISTARQNSALKSALIYIEAAEDSLKSGLPQDLAASDIERALGALAELDGRAVSEEVVANIFSRFCVGK